MFGRSVHEPKRLRESSILRRHAQVEQRARTGHAAGRTRRDLIHLPPAVGQRPGGIAQPLRRRIVSPGAMPRTRKGTTS
jgi:hypothetical protein